MGIAAAEWSWYERRLTLALRIADLPQINYHIYGKKKASYEDRSQYFIYIFFFCSFIDEIISNSEIFVHCLFIRSFIGIWFYIGSYFFIVVFIVNSFRKYMFILEVLGFLKLSCF